MKYQVITRKIKLNFVGEPDERKAYWERLRGLEESAFRMANYVSTHAYIQEKASEFTYFHEGYRDKLADRQKDPEGILNTSHQNTTYRMLSSKYKGEVPSDIYSQVNSIVRQTFKAESKEYFTGARSLRSYRRGMPIPFSKKSIRNIEKIEEWDGNYAFTLHDMRLRTWFGRDLSGNEIIMDRAVNGEYPMCDSSIKIEDNKIFLLLTVKVPAQVYPLDKSKELVAELGIETPIIFRKGKNEYYIGGKEEFLYRRLQIQEGRRRLQIYLKYSKGGKGRKKKLQALDRYEKAERNYVDTKIHQYTSKLVDFCVKLNCGTLVLKNQESKEEDAKEDEFLLRNWSYYGMKEKLKYKCNINGIELVER